MKLFLVGLMGSGKSFWAAKLNKLSGVPFYDLDTEIESKEKKTIAKIFEGKGEDVFRQIEAATLRSFSNKEQFILSTGGGTPCFYSNMQWMNEHGITIWIDESLDVIEKRLQKEKLHRPLISAIPSAGVGEFLSNMLRDRSNFYKQAKFHLRGDEITEMNFLKILSPDE